MAIDLNNLLANALLDRLDTEMPAGSFVEFRTGALPGAENAASGTLLASITLPATPWGAAASGSKAKSGTWQVNATVAGTIGHFRMKNAADTRRIEGTVTITAGGGDMTVDNLVTAVGQAVTVSTYAFTL